MEKPNALSEKEVLEIYQQVWAYTQRMQEQARGADWDALVETEGKRNLLIEKLRIGDKAAEGSPAFLESKATLIQNILKVDEEIRGLSREWVAELRGILDNLGAKKKIQKAYNV